MVIYHAVAFITYGFDRGEDVSLTGEVTQDAWYR